ncbi:hypothetical protein L1887_57825 [Cichorium endivia]|nr:hypothetical protein L1887_57825 [Cichorium endivia]
MRRYRLLPKALDLDWRVQRLAHTFSTGAGRRFGHSHLRSSCSSSRPSRSARGVIRADKAGIQFDQDHYTDAGAAIQRRAQTREERQWAELSTGDKALTWAKENKFSARVWAQGHHARESRGMAAITQIPSAGDKIIRQNKEANAHSWREAGGLQPVLSCKAEAAEAVHRASPLWSRQPVSICSPGQLASTLAAAALGWCDAMRCDAMRCDAKPFSDGPPLASINVATLSPQHHPPSSPKPHTLPTP